MRIAVVLMIAACSNASDSVPDATRRTAASDAPSDRDAASDAASTVDAGPLRIVVLNEVSAQSDPDWFEIVNATTSPLDLSEYIFVDKAGAFDKAVPFPAQTIGPGAYATQDCDGTTVPFKLASDEELWIYRASDHLLSDGVDWNEGDSPAGGSYARIPDTFGPFTTTMNPTKGLPNQP